jgi:hypothetical protein
VSRQFTRFADDIAKRSLERLADLSTDVEAYRQVMRNLGHSLADQALEIAPDVRDHQVCVVCTVEDADFLARGIVEKLEQHGLSHNQVRLACFWNERVRRFDDDEDDSIDIAPITKRYREVSDVHDSILILAKSIIRGTCVVKTNLASLLNSQIPRRIIVTAPVMFHTAPAKLAGSFPTEIAERFEYLTFAIDDRKEGPNVVPGVGGSPYVRLGFADTKSTYIPELVAERRSESQGAAA